jgi:hypothetical protein
VPLTQSPGQRLDDIQEYGYLGTTVGQNDLALNAPRLGFEAQRDVGRTRIATSIAFGEFKGAAYGGAPVLDNVTTHAARPEIELFANGPLFRNVDVNAEIVDGERTIVLPSRTPSTIGPSLREHVLPHAGAVETLRVERLVVSRHGVRLVVVVHEGDPVAGMDRRRRRIVFEILDVDRKHRGQER